MARTEEQKSPTAASPEKGGGPMSFLSRFFVPRAGTTTDSRNVGSSRSPQPARQQSRLGKLMFGWLILLVVVELGSTGLQYVNVRFNLGLLTPWFHTNAFFIGGINWFYVINLLVIVATYYFLVRFELIPRDLFSSRSQTAAAQAQPGKSSPEGMGRSHRSRAARRHATTTLGSGSSTASTRRSATKTPTKTRVATPPPPPPAPTGHDEEYYRVKAAQRQLRRREAKR
jgi:hypothetical protein